MVRLQTILKRIHPLVCAAILTGLITVGALVYAFTLIFSLQNTLDALTVKLEATNAALAEETRKLSMTLTSLDEKAAGIERKTEGIAGTLSAAQQSLQSTKEELATTKSQVEGTVKTVGTLEKLAQTDPELLQKYSKVYFLNENYSPQRLAEIDGEYLYNESKPEYLEYRVLPHLKDLINTAKSLNTTIYVKSAFRSFEEQEILKNGYTVTYGSGANTFSADQGYSEHQLGTTVDFITTGLNGQLTGFDTTLAYAWMLNNAHRFGFILSYPKGNTYYVFEPWHWRYVGIPLATYLYESKKNFYDLDQREIDTYLVSIFD